MEKIIEIDSEGLFVCDSFPELSPKFWTEDLTPDGMYRARYSAYTSDPDGRCHGGVWVDDGRTAEEVSQSNDSIKAALQEKAASAIVIWQTKLLIGRKLTDDEKSRLNAWLDYSDAVDAVDSSDVDPDWPKAPE